MTTVAFDGEEIAADTLATDNWGLKEEARNKIWVGDYLFISGAGNFGQITKWLRTLPKNITLEKIISGGYSPYENDKNEPSWMVVDRETSKIYYHASGEFLPETRRFFAIGSGRDYALAAMHLGRSASEAVQLAKLFDNGTGGDVVSYRRRLPV